jgi:hypothetical protein
MTVATESTVGVVHRALPRRGHGGRSRREDWGTREISVTLNTDFAAREKIENIKAILIVLLSVLAAVIHQSDCSRSPFSKKSPPTPLFQRGLGGFLAKCESNHIRSTLFGLCE